MSTVGIFEAKNQFSTLIALAERGSETVITRHGRPVARVAPLPTTTAVRHLGIWPDWEVPAGWDDWTDEDEALWYGPGATHPAGQPAEAAPARPQPSSAGHTMPGGPPARLPMGRSTTAAHG